MEHHLLSAWASSIFSNSGIRIMSNESIREGRLGDERGFTLLEMMVVVGLIGTLTMMALIAAPAFTNAAKADSAVEQVMDLMRSARELAVSQRRNVEVRFIGNTGLQTVRRDIGVGGASAGTTTLRTIELENKMQLRLDPAVTVDTPDKFGNATATSFGATGMRMFTSEGTFVDGNGDILNGSIFLSTPGLVNSGRAVTVMGATALVRSWRWDGKKWVE
jgi:prepilin-type N-terminal cleavage/methylation domain-containing protein